MIAYVNSIQISKIKKLLSEHFMTFMCFILSTKVNKLPINCNQILYYFFIMCD